MFSKFRVRAGALAMACCMTVGLAGMAAAADVTSDTDDGRIWLVDSGGSGGVWRDDDSKRETPGNSRGYTYEIKIHYEQVSGQDKVETVKGKAAAGADIPWRDELDAVREYKGKLYVLSGLVGNQDMSEKASENKFDVYYRLDDNDNGVPDKLDKDGKKADFKLVSVYTDKDAGRKITVENELKDKAWGDLMAESLDSLRELDDGVIYRLVRVEAPSIYVTGEASKNELRLFYEVDEISKSSTEKPVLSDNGVCPINGQPSWICNGTHDHAKMLEEMKKQENAASTSTPAVSQGQSNGVDSNGNSWDSENYEGFRDPVTWCSVHNQPAWVCAGQHN